MITLSSKTRESLIESKPVQPDPVMAFQLPSDGNYTLVVRDSLYRGREDFIYRISVGELPFIKSIFPLGGERGKKVKIRIDGVNIPDRYIKKKLKKDFPDKID